SRVFDKILNECVLVYIQAKAQLERARAVKLEELDTRPHRRTVAVTGTVKTAIHSEYSVYDTSFRDSFDGDLLRLVRRATSRRSAASACVGDALRWTVVGD